MKKFLTVLLALSVVFTYTVGTAFADTVLSEEQKYTNAVEQAEKTVADAVEDFLTTGVTYNGNGTLATAVRTGIDLADPNLTKSQIEKSAADFIAKWNKDIEAKARELYADRDWTTGDQNAMNAFIANVNDAGGVGYYLLADDLTVTTIYKVAVLDNVAKAEALIAGVDVSKYTGADKTAVTNAVNTLQEAIDTYGDTYSYAANNALCSAIESFSIPDTVLTDAEKEKALADAKEAAKNYEYTYHDVIYDGVVPFAEQEKEALRAALTAIANNLENSPAEIADAKAKLAVLDARVAELVEIYCAKIDAIEIEDGDLDAALAEVEEAFKDARVAVQYNEGYGALESNIEKLEGRDFLTTYANTYAQALKESFNQFTGEANYNAATVDKGLAEVIDKINKLELTTAAQVAAALDAIPDIAEETRQLKAYKVSAIAKLSEQTYADENWIDDYTGNLTAVKAIKAEYADKIDDAASKDEVDALVADAKAEMDKYLRAVEQRIVAGYANAENTAKYNKLFTDYAAGIDAKAPGAYSDAILNAAVAQAKEVLFDAVMAQQKALTNPQVKAVMADNYNAGLAKIDAIKTTAELNAIVADIEAAIAALDKVATLDNKAQYLAVQEKIEAVEDVAGFNKDNVKGIAGFENHMRKIVSLEKAAAEKAVTALPAATNVKLSDAAAIEAARAAVDAYDNAYGAYDDYGYAPVSNLSKLEAVEAALSNAQTADVAKTIAALPASVTLADKAAVDAVRAAYDALTDAQKKIFNPSLVAKLEACEKQLKELDIKAVESLKIKASSSAKKGSITVKWTVTGDASAADGFQVYKSTKAQKGYTFMGKTQKTSMVNKKNLKKGTRYYYKVRAYVDIDGVRYYSDWSNKANRIAK